MAATGDLGSIDGTGHLQLRTTPEYDRHSGGKNIYPEDVESAFSKCQNPEPCVFDELYLAQSFHDGETLTLVVRARESVEEDNLLQEVETCNRTSRSTSASAMLFWNDEFPRTASMKVKRLALVEQLQESSTEPALRSLP